MLYEVITVTNAEAALAQARRDSPDLVLLDIGLPGMDGLDALRQFKELFNLPVIFLTARRRITVITSYSIHYTKLYEHLYIKNFSPWNLLRPQD